MRCYESWAQQEVSGGRIELVLGASGAAPELEAEVAASMRPADRVVRVEGGSEIAVYDAAMRAAQAEVLLITEPHCIAEPGCVQELLTFIERGDYDGASCSSVGIAP